TACDVKVAADTVSTSGVWSSKILSLITGNALEYTGVDSLCSNTSISLILPDSTTTSTSSSPPYPWAVALYVPSFNSVISESFFASLSAPSLDVFLHPAKIATDNDAVNKNVAFLLNLLLIIDSSPYKFGI